MPETDLVVTRTFDAPVSRVWQTWTQSRYVQQWWKVDGFSNILADMDVREGGRSHVGMRASPEYGGRDYYNVFQYTRVVPNRLLVWTSNFADGKGNVLAPVAAGLPADTPVDKPQQAEFIDLGNGTTKVVVTERGWPSGSVMLERSRRGLEQTLANIAAVLAQANEEDSQA